MAKNLSESAAFEVGESRTTRLAARRNDGRRPKREMFQLNCLVSTDLKIPLQVARAKESKCSGDIIEPLLRDYLSRGGYLD